MTDYGGFENLALDPVARGVDTSRHDYCGKQTELVVVPFCGEGGWLVCNICSNQQPISV